MLPVDRQPFELVEHPFVRRVLRLVAVDAAGHDHAHRRRRLLHDARLHRRGVRAQHDLAGQIDVDRVPDVARRVVARDVEQIEVVVRGLHLGTEHGLEPEQGEDLAQLVDHLRDRMRSAENRWTAGQGHVDGVRGETLLEILGDERGVPGAPGSGELGLERVATPTGDRSLVGREGGQTAQKECQLPLGTEKCPFPGNDLVE